MFRTMIALAIVSVLAVTADAYRPSMQTVSGLVLSERGEPIHEAKVEFLLVTTYGRFIRVTASTDRDGKYMIQGIPESKGIGMAWGHDPGRGPVEQPVEITKKPNIYHFSL